MVTGHGSHRISHHLNFTDAYNKYKKNNTNRWTCMDNIILKTFRGEKLTWLNTLNNGFKDFSQIYTDMENYLRNLYTDFNKNNPNYQNILKFKNNIDLSHENVLQEIQKLKLSPYTGSSGYQNALKK